MGLFDFVKEAGEKLGLGGGKKDGGEEVEEYVREQTKANAIWHHVQQFGFAVEDLNIQFDDGTATVRGETPTQEDREKVILAVGNVAGVARVDDRIEVVAPAPEATFYTVKSGDTLSAIARDHYGDASLYPEIFDANRPMLKDPDLIYPGQVLRIPAREA